MMRASLSILLAATSLACSPRTPSSPPTAGSGGGDEQPLGSRPGVDESQGDGRGTLQQTDETAAEGPDQASASGQPEAAHEGEASAPEPDPDSVSETPSTATFSHCEPATTATECADCAAGLTVPLVHRSRWRSGTYDFEVLTEGNHIRCRARLPCDDPAPIPCHSSPGAPQVAIETEGCGGPPDHQKVAALRFSDDACPSDVRIEAYRDQIRIAADTLRPHYGSHAACEGRCTAARINLSISR